MKKLLGIVVLGLLWCNVGFAEKITVLCIDKKTKAKTYISFYNEGGKNKIKINGEESTEGLEAKNGKYISTTVITINEKSLSFLHLEYDKDFELNIYINRYTGEMLRYGHVLNEKFSNSAICKKSEIEKSF